MAQRHQIAKHLFTIRRYAEMGGTLLFALYFLFGTFFQHGIYQWIPSLIIVLGGIIIAATAFFFGELSTTNTLFTKVPEGSVKEIVRGKGGSVSHFVMAFKGYHLNDARRPWYDPNEPDWEVLQNAPGRTDKDYDDRMLLTRWIGIYPVGIPKFREVFTYNFVWNEPKSMPDGSTNIWNRNEETELILVKKFSYLFCLPSVITEDGLEVRVEYLVTINVTNPNIALNETDKWLTQIQAATESIARGFINNNAFKVIRCQNGRSAADGLINEGFAKPIIALTQSLTNEKDPEHPLGTRGAYGVTIDTVDLLDLDLTGDAKKQEQEAVLAVFQAQQLGDAKRITADADAYTIRVKGEAEANATELNGKANANAMKAKLSSLIDAGDLGALLLQSDALIEASKGAGSNFVWATSPFGITNPLVAKALDSLKAKPEDVKEALNTKTESV